MLYSLGECQYDFEEWGDCEQHNDVACGSSERRRKGILVSGSPESCSEEKEEVEECYIADCGKYVQSNMYIRYLFVLLLVPSAEVVSTLVRSVLKLQSPPPPRSMSNSDIHIQSTLYIKGNQRNQKMWPLCAVAFYLQVNVDMYY
jgi:hypothetical protein